MPPVQVRAGGIPGWHTIFGVGGYATHATYATSTASVRAVT